MTARLLILALTVALVLLPAGEAGLAKGSAGVGSVTAIGGTKDVRIRATPKGPSRKAKVKTTLRLGATVVMGKGASATLRLTRPAGAPTSRSLVFVTSAKGTKHTSIVSRDGTILVVTITPG
jgi:hypothetical protein